jgi:tetratricopeptide (TPR) repeat protein
MILETQNLEAQQRIVPDVQSVRDLYERGLMTQAYEAGLRFGPLETWQGCEAKVMAGRLAAHLGAPRLSTWILRCAHKQFPQDTEARYYYAYGLWRRRGPYPAWQWLQKMGEPSDATAPPDLLSSWYALVGEVAGMLRDFDTAELWLSRAADVAPQNAWVKVCQAQLLEFEDRYDEALEKAQQALALRPLFRPAVQTTAHLLTLLDRDQEALELLNTAAQRLESSAITGQLFALQLELKQFARASRTLDRFSLLSPLAEKEIKQWLAGARAEVAYFLGDTAEAIRSAKESDNEYWKSIAERLEQPPRAEGKIVTLPVGFVRQHHFTCVPATLSAISRFWSMPADHLQVSDEICYNGTSHFHERKWAREHGWTAREFSVTEDSAVALLNRGVPFTFTTVDPGNSHLQAIIGYDGRRGTLIVRDPFWRNSGEALADKLLERYAAYGPRGMALVPQAKAERLEGVQLPDAELWDLLHELDGALVEHHRDAAQATYERMRVQAAEHRLVFEARRRLAVYDGNVTEHLAALDLLVARFPEDQSLQLERLSVLRNQAHRDERLAIYRQLCEKKETHPIFWQQYAQELRIDARRHEDAVLLLQRAIRRWPTEAANYYILANIYWDQRRFPEALELYRFAASLGNMDEQLVEQYFLAANWFRQTDAALLFLRDRVARFGKKSSQPARTLANAFMQLDRNGEALAAIDEALVAHPDDGQLMLYAADLYLGCSMQHMPRARQLVEQARDKAPRGVWLRTAARMAHTDGRHAEALALWQEVLALQPLAIDAHRAVSRLLAEIQGPAAALQHLEEAADRFPHHFPLHELWIEWIREEPPSVREPVVRRVVAVNPDDAWIHRELGFLLAGERRLEEAWAECEIASRLEPMNVSLFLLRAQLLRSENRLDDARAALRQAIELSVDNDYAIAELIELCDTVADRRAVMAFVKEQLVKQVTFGDGLLNYRTYARDTLAPDELLADLRTALAARPDLWHAWSAIVVQLLNLNHLDEAWAVIQQACERFPLMPRLWLDRAQVCRARKDMAGELDALENAYRISPGWGHAVRTLCEALERRGRYDDARELLEHAVARNPLEAANRAMLAEALWHVNRREEALAAMQQVVQLEPGYDRSWELLSAWSDELGCPEKALETVRELTARRAGEARSWLFLARLLDAPEQLDERLAAIDKAIELNVRCTDAHDLRATALGQAGRWDEAEAACHPEAWNGHPPMELRARSAWLQAEQGNLGEAIERMKAVVADEPQFFGAWSRLADWCQHAEDKEGYLQASEALVRINPQYEVSYGYLGEARLLNGDRKGAVEAYRHGFELNPQYEFAGNALFDLQMEDGDLAGAAATVGVLKSHSQSGYVLARDSQLAARQGDQQRTLANLRQVCVTESQTNWPIEATVKAAVDAGWAGPAEQALKDVLWNDKPQPTVGSEWVALSIERRDWTCGELLRELVEKGPAGEAAVYTYVDALYKEERADQLIDFVHEHGDWLLANTFTWGAVGYALTGIRNYSLAAQWHSDWRNREDARPWMLVNAVEAFRNTGRDLEAVEVGIKALDMPHAQGQNLNCLWLATSAVESGDFQKAAEYLDAAGFEELDEDYVFLDTCVRAAVDMSQAHPDEADEIYRECCEALLAARRNYKWFDKEPARKRAFLTAVTQVAKTRGTLFAKLWAWWTRLG